MEDFSSESSLDLDRSSLCVGISSKGWFLQATSISVNLCRPATTPAVGDIRLREAWHPATATNMSVAAWNGGDVMAVGLAMEQW